MTLTLLICNFFIMNFIFSGFSIRIAEVNNFFVWHVDRDITEGDSDDVRGLLLGCHCVPMEITDGGDERVDVDTWFEKDFPGVIS